MSGWSTKTVLIAGAAIVVAGVAIYEIAAGSGGSAPGLTVGTVHIAGGRAGGIRAPPAR